jgi:L-ascorbate metabolism protein UlaG (beta-lactamase superfamily)
MRITWYGHAGFLIEGDGHRIIMDPCSSACGYAPVDDTADIVTISHVNPKYHSCLDAIHGNPIVVNGLEILANGCDVDGVQFEAVEVFEDDAGGGPNAMICFTIEGIRIGHMGDLGHALGSDQLETLRDVDLLLALAGGPPTIELADLKKVIDIVQPAISIPMHYLTDKIDMNILPVTAFTELFPAERIRERETSWIDIAADALPTAPEIHVLQHAR